MHKMMLALVLSLLVPTLLPAQNRVPQSYGLGYFAVGGATHQMGQIFGFGGEYVSHGFGVGLEADTAGWATTSNGNPNWIGLGSADFSGHFLSRQTRGRAVPFVTVGPTVFFGQDTDTPGGNVTFGYHVGGGVDLFAVKHIGVWFDVRYHGGGGRILWASFPNGGGLSFTVFRIGLTFR